MTTTTAALPSILTGWRPSGSGLTVVCADAPAAFPNGRTIARTDPVSVPSGAERQAIVRLIAAAPGLLAACERLLAVIDEPHEATAEKMAEATVGMRDAIACAKGEAQ